MLQSHDSHGDSDTGSELGAEAIEIGGLEPLGGPTSTDLPLPPTDEPSDKKMNYSIKDMIMGRRGEKFVLPRQKSADVKEIYELFDDFQPGNQYQTSPLAIPDEIPREEWANKRRSGTASSTSPSSNLTSATTGDGSTPPLKAGAVFSGEGVGDVRAAPHEMNEGHVSDDDTISTCPA
jgi:hypothetical protein